MSAGPAPARVTTDPLISPAALSSLFEAGRKVAAVYSANAAAFARAYSRTARAKREAAKRALVALLNTYAPHARALWTSPARPVSRTCDAYLPPRPFTLLSPNGPHAPPVMVGHLRTACASPEMSNARRT